MTKFRKALKNEKGFTLIELLVVVVIIGVLSAIAVPNLVGASDKAKEKRVQADLKVIQTALESYYVDNSKYPETADAKDVLVNEKYLKVWPSDPWTSSKEYEYTKIDDGFKVNDSVTDNIYLNQTGIQEEK